MIESVKQIASMTWSMMCKYGLSMADGNNSSHTLTSVDLKWIPVNFSIVGILIVIIHSQISKVFGWITAWTWSE